MIPAGDDDQLLRNLLTDHLPDPPSTSAPTGLRRRAARRTTTTVLVTTVGLLAAVAVSTAALAGRGDEPPAPADPFAHLKPESWSHAFVTTDDRTIVVAFEHGACDGPWELRLDERPDRVALALVDTGPDRSQLPCSMQAIPGTVQVTLAASLAGRTVVDAATGLPRQVISRGRIPTPTYPPASEYPPTFAGMDPFSSGNVAAPVWMYYIEWSGRFLSILLYDRNADGWRPSDPVVREASVRGHVATMHSYGTDVAGGRVASSAQLSWTEGDWRFVINLSQQDPGDVDALLAELLKVADGLR